MIEFNVKTPCPEINEMLQKLAFKAGYKWPSGVDEPTKIYRTEATALKFKPNGIINFYSDPDSSLDTFVTLDEAIGFLFLFTPTCTAELGSYKAQFRPGEDVVVGCQTITAEQISTFIKLWSKGN
jgi:hypothetical protein